MLLPALSKAREKARSISCVNNLKTQGLAFMTYAQDNDDYFPLAGIHSGTYQDMQKSIQWYNSIKPYLGSNGTTSDGVDRKKNNLPLMCPSVTYPTTNYIDRYGATPEGKIDLIAVAYAYNMRLSAGMHQHLKKPANSVCTIDRNETGVDHRFIYRNTTSDIRACYANMNDQVCGRRHNKASNNLMTDGHVETLKELTLEQVQIDTLNPSAYTMTMTFP